MATDMMEVSRQERKVFQRLWDIGFASHRVKQASRPARSGSWKSILSSNRPGRNNAWTTSTTDIS
eukprot:5526488-Amphidinium_carterae.1